MLADVREGAGVGGGGLEPILIGPWSKETFNLCPGDTESESLFTVIQAAEQILELRATL